MVEGGSLTTNDRHSRGAGRRSGVRATLALAVLGLSVLDGGTPSAGAQTAHFSGALTTLADVNGNFSVNGNFATPGGVAVDASGDVFVADTGNNAVKEILAVNGSIPANPTINILGTGFSGPRGVAVDGNGNVFVADSLNNAIKEILAAGGYTTVNTLASVNGNFTLPIGVAVDGSGNVFVSDSGNNAIKEILAAGGYITVNTLASGNFSNPAGVAVDGSGNVFVADTGNNAVKEILASSGSIPASPTINTLASGNFSGPQGVAVDGSGDVFVADTANNAIKEIVAVNGSIPSSNPTINTSFSGFSSPAGVAADGHGNVFMTDTGNGVVNEIMLQGVNFGSAAINNTSTPVILELFFTFDSAGAIGAPVVLTQGAAGLDFTNFDADSGCSVPESFVHQGDTCALFVSFTPKLSGVRKGAVSLTSSSLEGPVVTIATANVFGTGTGPQVAFSPGAQSVLASANGHFSFPGSVAVDGNGNVFVADTDNIAVKEILAAGGYTTVNTLANGSFDVLSAVAVDGSGNVFVADSDGNAIKEILAPAYTTINTLASANGNFRLPRGVAVDGSGNVFVADSLNDAIKEILAPAYTIVNTLASANGNFNSPVGVAVDGNGNVFVTSVTTIKEILAPAYTTVNTLASGNIGGPEGLAVDGNGNLFVADTGNNAVKEILAPAYTTINTLASGFNQPESVAVDGHGNVFVADTNNNAVKELDFADPPILGSFASTASGSTSSDSPKTVTFENIGNAALTFPLPGTGLNPSIAAGFTVGNSSTCPQLTTSSSTPATLAVEASCTYLISFTPTIAGAISGSLVTTDNSLNAASATQSIALSGIATPLTPVITFTVPNHTFGDAPFTVSASSNSTGAFIYSVVSGPATISGSTVTLTGAGPVVLQASEVADPSFIAGTKNASFTVAPGTPTIVFTVPNHTFGDVPFTVSATSNSTGAFTYSVVSGPATISGSTVTLTGIGPVVLQASEVADSNFTAGTQNASFMVAATTPTIVFTVPNHSFGDAPFMVSASSNSTGAFIYSVVSGLATISGSTVTLTGAGPVVLQASELADPSFIAATKNASFTVATGTPTIVFTVPNHSFGDVPFTVSASSNSTGAFIYSVVSGPAMISGSTVTLTGAGPVVLQASEAADPNFVASTKNASFTVATGTPMIVFTVPNHSFGDAPFMVSASSNSTGAFIYSVVSGPATISGSTVTLTGAGPVVLQASEAADPNFVASTKNASFTVAPGTPTIVFTVPNHSFGDAPFTVSASSNSTGAFIYSVVSGPATISGSTVTLTGGGPVVLQASEAADPNFVASTKNASFTVATTTTTPTIVFTVPNHTLGDAPFTVSASSNSTGAFTYFVSGPATISGSTVTLTGTGTVVIQAFEAADTNFVAGNKNASFMVAAGTPAITFAVPNHTFADAPFTVGASSNSTGAFTYSVASGPATISGSTVTLTGVGPVVLQASEAADPNFVAGTKNASFTVAAGTPTIVFIVPNHTFGDTPFPVSASSNTTGALTYSVVSGPAMITGSTVTLTSPGTVVLSAIQAASGNYSAATATTSFTVAMGFTLGAGSGSAGSGSSTSITPGGAASFSLTLNPGAGATFPDAINFSASGLPPGATATFSPAILAAGSSTTAVTLTIQTSSSQTARSENPFSRKPRIPVTMGFLLLPLLGLTTVRKRYRQISRFSLLALAAVSLGAMLMGLSGCAGASNAPSSQPATNYIVVVIATDATTGMQHTTNLPLTVQ